VGTVRVQGQIESDSGRSADQTFLVDTGSFYSAVSKDLRQLVDLPRGYPAQVRLADGRVIDTEVVLAKIRIMDREGIVPVEIVEVPESLLGVSALEVLGLKVNPVTRTLEYERPYREPPSFTRFRPS